MKKGLHIIFLSFLILFGCSNETSENLGSNITGIWTGEVDVANQALAIQTTFDQGEELTGTISIPVQGIQNYPFQAVNIKDEDNLILILDFQGQYITFDGKISEQSITGTFKQYGQSFPFELRKGASIVYDEESNNFMKLETSHGIIYGEIETPPKEEGPYPVVIIIPGSGPTDRNGNSAAGENNSLKMLAEELAANGIASLRYDKRGAGKNQLSIIPEENMRFIQFVDDAVAWIELLKQDPTYSDVAIIGHSQGSLVGMLAAQETAVSHFISIAGAGRAIDEVLIEQLKGQLSNDLLKEGQRIITELKNGQLVEEVSPELQPVFRPKVQPFMVSWMTYDPREEIAKLEVPSLIVNGKNDLQVPVQDAELLNHAGKNTEILLIDSMNHVLKDAPANEEGNLASYTNPGLPLAEGLVDGITNFLRANK